MSLARIRDEFRVPARLGARVTAELAHGRHDPGAVVGSTGDHILIQFDDALTPEPVHPRYLTFHPTTKEN